MIRAFYSAGLGLTACQERLGLRGENISNAETVGYKSQEACFSETLYSAVALSGGGEYETGSGVRLMGVSSSTEQGGVQPTGRPLDLMLEGDGYFCVKNGDGSLSYTRAGNFYRSADGWLVSAHGGYVMDGNLQRVRVDDEENIKFTASRSYYERDLAEVGVFTFRNPAGLTRQGEGLLAAAPASGPAVRDTDAQLRQGSLERSSVDLAEEMTQMIKAQRGFQANARMIRTADELEETANQLRS